MSAGSMEPEIILASSSPRRQAFMRDLGYTFAVCVADIDETPFENEVPTTLARRLAQEKALAVAGQLSAEGGEYLIVAADTVVALGQTILGKPVDERDAAAMLRLLRGKPHQVHSGVCVLSNRDDTAQTRLNTTTVWMRAYTDEEVAAYVATGDPLDKAGAYAIQHPGFVPANQVEGCLSGVIGLPLAEVCELLGEYGFGPVESVVATCEQHTQFSCCQRGGEPG